MSILAEILDMDLETWVTGMTLSDFPEISAQTIGAGQTPSQLREDLL
jgi:hypothetical protein